MSEYSKERLAQLAGITKKSTTTNRSQIIKESVSAKNAKVSYAIISEASVFYIKESRDGGKTYNYIGGENNKNKNHRYTKLSVAENNLNFLLKSVNEGMSYGYGFKNEADEETDETAMDDMSSDDAPAEDAPVDNVPAEETAPDAETEPMDDMPAPDAEGETTDGEGEDDFLADMDSEDTTETAPDAEGGDAPMGDTESDGETITAMEAAGQIQNTLGQVNEAGAQETYNALAQILSAIDDTLMGMMTPEDLVKAGEKFQELADKYAPKQEGKKMESPMKEAKKLDDMNESEIKKLIEKYDIMNKPRIKYKLKKLSEAKEKAKLLENKIEKKRLLESKNRKKK
jgi:hypothetical protein